jgi:hypothetical protein
MTFPAFAVLARETQARHWTLTATDRLEHRLRRAAMSKSGLLPEGEALRNAVRWISVRRLELPNAPASKLIDEAALRFDLSPRDVEFLTANWNGAGRKTEPPQSG